jgi:hypothetical protein
MSTNVTLSIPDEVLETAQRWANFLGHPVDDLLVETIQSSLLPMGAVVEFNSVGGWTDAEVLSAAQQDLSPSENSRLSDLLHKQQARDASAAEVRELQELMILYQARLLRKARALREAVQRGLMEPLQP